MRHSPHPWRVKARMLLVTQTQATYAQGTHSFQLDLDLLKKVRSNVMRCLWSSDFYTMNPNVTFALLVPPHLDPLFGHIYQRFRTILRCMQEPSFAACLKSRFHFAAADLQEGPALRLRNFSRQGPFRPLVLQLMSGPVQPEQWAHDLRMAWRGELWARAARARPQHFAEQKIMDLGVLRRLLCGGLMTEERDAQHRKQEAVPKCACGGTPTVLHISWSCPLHDDLRQPLFQQLGHNGDILPQALRYATLVPSTYEISQVHVSLIQKKNRKDLETFNKGGHDLDWNRRVGKVPGAPDEGIITCRSCKLTWSWRYRHTTLKNSICKGPSEPASTAHVRLDDPRPRPTRRLLSMSLPQVMLHPPRPPLLHGGVALDECFAKGALTLCAVALFPSLNFFGPPWSFRSFCRQGCRSLQEAWWDTGYS